MNKKKNASDKSIEGLNQKLDLAIERLEHMSTNSGYAMLKAEESLSKVEKLMVSTKEDMARLENTMATKDSLTRLENTMATKDSLTRLENTMATKDSLAKLENTMATKMDVLATAVLKNERDIQQIKESMSTKDDIQRVLDQIDHYTERFKVENRKMWFHDHRLNELEPKIEDHEKRLTVLEAKQ